MTTYVDMEASYLLWDLIWKKDSPSFTELNMLDAVTIRDRRVQGWLFTSSNGVVKSKLPSNWRREFILNRAANFRNCLAHYYHPQLNKWIYISDPDALYQLLESVQQTALLLHPHLNKGSTFMEVTYTKQARGQRLEIPSYTNSWLCDLGIKERHARAEAVRQERADGGKTKSSGGRGARGGGA
ncbi:hypothetical protein B484DRAFT_483031, partial [Ochromonadaceae sp. CCMP2298]